MPITKRWSRFTRENIERLPKAEGAYELANASKSVIYQGSSNNVRNRLLTHLILGKFPTVRYFRCELLEFFDLESGTDKEARHAKRFFPKHGRKPKYTKRSPRKRALF